MDIILLLMIIKNKMVTSRGNLVNYERYLTGVLTTWSKWKTEARGRMEREKEGQGPTLTLLPRHARHFGVGWPKSLFEFLSIPSYRKTWTNILANPIAPQPCKVWFILLIENSRSLEGVTVAPRAMVPMGLAGYQNPGVSHRNKEQSRSTRDLLQLSSASDVTHHSQSSHFWLICSKCLGLYVTGCFNFIPSSVFYIPRLVFSCLGSHFFFLWGAFYILIYSEAVLTLFWKSTRCQ